MLESAGFDLRTRHPQNLVIKLMRKCQLDPATIGKTAFNMCIDVYRTFAPLKQTTSTLAFACIELSARLSGKVDIVQLLEQSGATYARWSTKREMIMGKYIEIRI